MRLRSRLYAYVRKYVCMCAHWCVRQPLCFHPSKCTHCTVVPSQQAQPTADALLLIQGASTCPTSLHPQPARQPSPPASLPQCWPMQTSQQPRSPSTCRTPPPRQPCLTHPSPPPPSWQLRLMTQTSRQPRKPQTCRRRPPMRPSLPRLCAPMRKLLSQSPWEGLDQGLSVRLMRILGSHLQSRWGALGV